MLGRFLGVLVTMTVTKAGESKAVGLLRLKVVALDERTGLVPPGCHDARRE
jgi:hypothetical protein